MTGFLTGCIHNLFHIPHEAGTNGVGRKAVTNDSALVYLSYRENGMRNCTEYELRTEGDGMLFSFSKGWSEAEPLTCPADDGLAAELHALYEKHRAAEWDGYNKYLTEVKDGWGFLLILGFADGQRMSVSGENCSPDGFREFRNELLALLEPYREKLTADGTAK